jgi:hypothetical protein
MAFLALEIYVVHDVVTYSPAGRGARTAAAPESDGGKILYWKVQDVRYSVWSLLATAADLRLVAVPAAAERARAAARVAINRGSGD